MLNAIANRLIDDETNLWLHSLHHGSDATDVRLQLLSYHLDTIAILNPSLIATSFKVIGLNGVMAIDRNRTSKCRSSLFKATNSNACLIVNYICLGPHHNHLVIVNSLLGLEPHHLLLPSLLKLHLVLVHHCIRPNQSELTFLFHSSNYLPVMEL